MSIGSHQPSERARDRGAMKGPGQVSVIVPAFGRPDLVRKALESVARQTRPPAEVIVVDDGSEPPLAAVVAEYGVRYLRRPNGGAAGAAARAPTPR